MEEAAPAKMLAGRRMEHRPLNCNRGTWASVPWQRVQAENLVYGSADDIDALDGPVPFRLWKMEKGRPYFRFLNQTTGKPVLNWGRV